MYTERLLHMVEGNYDAVETELKVMLSTEQSNDPNPTLMSMSHTDLALLADQYRVRLLKGSQAMPLTNAQGAEEEPLPTTDVDNE